MASHLTLAHGEVGVAGTAAYDIIDVMHDRGASVYEILRLVRPIVLNSARAVEAQVRRHGWTVGSRAVMEVLVREGPLRAPEIADHLSVARQNVQRHINDLVTLGHVTTSPNPAHRRSVLVRPTEDGIAAFRETHERELVDLEQVASECSDSDLATAASVLAALLRDIHARTPSADDELEN